MGALRILLDEFISTVAREKMEQEMIKTEHEQSVLINASTGPLDPLIAGMVDFTNIAEHEMNITNLYTRFDLDEGGGVDFSEFNKGLNVLGLPQLTKDEWEIITDKGLMLDSNRELSPAGFRAVINTEMYNYCQRRLGLAMARCKDEGQKDLMLNVKLLNT